MIGHPVEKALAIRLVDDNCRELTDIFIGIEQAGQDGTVIEFSSIMRHLCAILAGNALLQRIYLEELDRGEDEGAGARLEDLISDLKGQADEISGND